MDPDPYYALWFAGAGSALIGAVCGAAITAFLSYRYQRRLLLEQIEAQKTLAAENSKMAKEFFEGGMRAMNELEMTLRKMSGHLIPRIHETISSKPKRY